MVGILAEAATTMMDKDIMGAVAEAPVHMVVAMEERVHLHMLMKVCVQLVLQ